MRDEEQRYVSYELEVSALIDQLAESQVLYRQRFRLVDTHFNVIGNSYGFAELIEPSFRNLLFSLSTKVTGYEVVLFEGATSKFSSPASFWQKVFSDQKPANPNSAQIFNTKRFRIGLLPGLGILFGLDFERERIIYWTENLNSLSTGEFAGPLKLNLLWWATSTGLQLLHAGSVGGEVGAVLIIGPSGKGKSTLSIGGAVSGRLSFIGDDSVLASVGESPIVHSIYSSAKLDKSSLDRFPELVAAKVLRKNSEKFVLDLTLVKEICLVKSLPLKAVILPNYSTNGQCKLQAISPSVAQLQMVPSTTVYSLGVERESFVRANKLIAALPCFAYSYSCPREAGKNLKQILGEAGIQI